MIACARTKRMLPAKRVIRSLTRSRGERSARYSCSIWAIDSMFLWATVGIEGGALTGGLAMRRLPLLSRAGRRLAGGGALGQGGDLAGCFLQRDPDGVGAGGQQPLAG